MKIRFNKNETVSIQQMPKEMYYAIRKILSSAENAFYWNEDADEWWSNGDFLCSLLDKEKELLDKSNWLV